MLVVPSIYGNLVNRADLPQQYRRIVDSAVLNKTQIRKITRPREDNIVFRVSKYVSEHKRVLYQIVTYSGEGFSDRDLVVYGGAVSAALFATFVGGTTAPPGTTWVYDAYHDYYTPILPLGTSMKYPSPKAFLLAIGVAITAVAVGNAARNIYKIKNSDAYAVWKQNRGDLLIEASKKSVLTSDDVLKNFLCPLSKALPDCPVRAPNHCTYDRKVLRRKLQELAGRKALPQGGPIFTLAEVSFDFGFANSIIARLKTIIMTMKRSRELQNGERFQEFFESYGKKVTSLSANREDNYTVACQGAIAAFAASDERPRYDSEIEDLRITRNHLKTVRQCTNSFWARALGWLGVKKKMISVDCIDPSFYIPLRARRIAVVDITDL